MNAKIAATIGMVMMIAAALPSFAQPVLRGGVDANTGTSSVEVTQRRTGMFLAPAPLATPILRPLSGAKLDLPTPPQLPKMIGTPFDMTSIENGMNDRLQQARQRLDYEQYWMHPGNGFGRGPRVEFGELTIKMLRLPVGEPPAAPHDFQERVHIRLLEQQTLMQGQQQTGTALPPLPVTRLRHPEKNTTSADILSWDEWYKHLSQLLKDPLLDAMAKYEAPPGANTIRVTVNADHKLTIAIEKSGGPEFDTAIVEAYSSVDGNPELAFPKGSLRGKVSFLTDHRHSSDAPVDDVTTFTLKGDKESVFTY
jgi:hypothetical protein